jgi:hypothetical protein
MRVVAEIPHPEFKISIFAWNAKFILKIEVGPYEQAFRINEETVSGDIEKVKAMVTEEFLKDFRTRFLAMREDLNNALKKVNTPIS